MIVGIILVIIAVCGLLAFSAIKTSIVIYCILIGCGLYGFILIFKSLTRLLSGKEYTMIIIDKSEEINDYIWRHENRTVYDLKLMCYYFDGNNYQWKVVPVNGLNQSKYRRGLFVRVRISGKEASLASHKVYKYPKGLPEPIIRDLKDKAK